MKKGFSVFLIKVVILWAIIIGLVIMMFVSPKNDEVNTAQVAINVEEQEVAFESSKTTNPLQMIAIFGGFGLLMSIVYLLKSRCGKCGEWFAMGKTITERVPIGEKSKTKGKSRNKFGLGILLAILDPRLWFIGLRSGGKNYNSTTDTRIIWGLKKTNFCLECGYEKVKMPKR